MNAELFHGFDSELSMLKETLRIECENLEALEEPEACALQRHRIAAVGTLIGHIEGARTTIIIEEGHAEETVRKFKIWRERVAKAHDAKLALEPFQRTIPEAQSRVDQGERNLSIAQTALADHLTDPIRERDYASQKTIREWEVQKTDLESAVKKRTDELRSLKENLSALRGQWMKATEEFDRASFNERMARLPKAPEKPAGVGTLSAIR